MQSLKAKFNESSKEVLDFIGQYGIFAAMTRYQVKDYTKIKKWIREETGNENFGIRPKLDNYPGEDAFDKLARFLMRAIYEVQAHNEKLAEENNTLRAMLNLHKREDEEKALTTLEAFTNL